jgi:hypothetical protein
MLPSRFHKRILRAPHAATVTLAGPHARRSCLTIACAAAIAVGCQEPMDSSSTGDRAASVTQEPLTVSSAAALPDEAMSAATDGLNKWRNRLGDLVGGATSFKEVTLGEPYLVYDAPLDIIINNTTLSESDLVQRDLWFFPIVADGRYLLWMKVKKTPEGWKTVGIGGSSGELQALEQDIKDHGVSAKRSIVQVISLGLDFIAIEKDDNGHGYPGVLSAEFYPYGSNEGADGVQRPSLRARRPTDKRGMLGLMKDRAEVFEHKGVKR